MIPHHPDPTFGCHRYSGRKDKDGYGRLGNELAHRVAWERVHGPVPEGQFLDHLCRRRDCIRLAHLEIVDRRENERRKRWRYRVKRERCAAGHDLRRFGMVTPEGGKVCRVCNKEAR